MSLTDDAFGYASARELHGLYAAGEAAPSEAVAAVLRRIEALDPGLNAFSSVMAEEAMAAARASDARFAAGEARPLEGVPVTIKDFYDVAGQPTETGSWAVRKGPAAADNPVTARLRAAGAVIVGKTTMSEFAWSGISRNPVNGITHNPWGHGLNAGASSAGAGVAAAAGFGPLHLGSDGAGSIRMPAHFCGVFGLKPTYGRVPHVPVSNTDYAAYIGPMTRTVADGAAMLKVMAGPHPLDHTSAEAPPADYPALLDRPLRGRRIAFSPDLGHARVDPEVAQVVARAVKSLEDLGAQVEEISPPWGPLGPDLGRFYWTAFLGRRAALLEEYEARMGADLVACIREGAHYSATDYLDWRERKFAYVAQIAQTLQAYDLLVTPAASVAAFPVELVQPEHWHAHAWDWLAWAQFSYPFNMSGDPACSVPCGVTPAGLPVGLQIVARRFDDLGVLQAAHAFEQARGPFARPPL
ncbi:amidase [Albimonas pacifica]|uniref:Aspartyl-tRNA(Asn)/glutamyl-tRNA(Gln) amidotransferase subunit A n=1 Tax=Albimonas pacifica TaxID=1114924 RepID=A0A1I3BK24_9RHOB|nr:amidase family protein [Albimonas pacifica]SFH62081.1 aspartyl-tRNA(Asn)/glutamyl-tRNA(Gln) amidotransferase subunit A [Albimonas pacifica]